MKMMKLSLHAQNGLYFPKQAPPGVGISTGVYNCRRVARSSLSLVSPFFFINQQARLFDLRMQLTAEIAFFQKLCRLIPFYRYLSHVKNGDFLRSSRWYSVCSCTDIFPNLFTPGLEIHLCLSVVPNLFDLQPRPTRFEKRRREIHSFSDDFLDDSLYFKRRFYRFLRLYPHPKPCLVRQQLFCTLFM